MGETLRSKANYDTSKVIALCFYLVAGPATIYMNKYILTTVHFPYGATLSLCGITMTTVVSLSLVATGRATSEQLRGISPRFFVVRVLPIGVMLGGTLATGNAAYLYCSVAFVQILKAFAPVILMLLLFATRVERPRALVVCAIGIISLGTVVCVDGELSLSLRGVALMLFSELFEAIKLINMQILLGEKKYESVEGMVVIGPAAMIALGVVAYLTEDVGDALAIIVSRPSIFVLASCGGLAVNMSTSMMVRATSALTLRITALARNVAVIGISTLVLGEPVTFQECAGYTISVAGMLVYQHSRLHPNETLGTALAAIKARLKRVRCRLTKPDPNSDVLEQQTKLLIS